MEGATEFLTHPVFGTLGWLPQYLHWFAQPTRANGTRPDVILDPHDGDRYAFLPRAAELFLWAIDHQEALLDEAIRSMLLELYNERWCQEGDPELDAAAFKDVLCWDLLTIRAWTVQPVEFGYDPGELFGGHCLTVRVDGELRYRGAGLM